MNDGAIGAAPGSGFDLAHPKTPDDPVLANRRAAAAWAGAPVVWLNQVHGADVVPVTTARDGLVGDAAVTTRTDVTLAVLVADCVPVLLADVAAGVIAVAHAGRAGVARDVVGATIDAMRTAGAAENRIAAAIGPAICGRCYEVPAQLRHEVAQIEPEAAAETAWGTPSLNLPRAVAAQLGKRGVTRISRSTLCTRTHPGCYSYRRNPETGRFAGLVRLMP